MAMKSFYQQYFDTKDKEGKGYLTKDQLVEALLERKYKKERAEEIFAELDTSKDGKVNKDELVKYMEKDDVSLSDKLNMVKDMCKKWDKNGDGQIGKDEMKAVLEAAYGFEVDQDLVDMSFDMYDPEGTGFVSFETILKDIFRVGYEYYQA